jgi:hypothetical protein
MAMAVTFPDDTMVGSDEVRNLLITVGVYLLAYWVLSELLGWREAASMTLTFPDGTVLSLDVFSLLAITTILFFVVMGTSNVLETWLKERRREWVK